VLPAKSFASNPYDGAASVMLLGHKPGLSPQMKHELKRRSGIEVTIRHMRTDGPLGRNFLAGHTINALAFLLAWTLHTAR
jgi:IS5 family transposase